MVTATRPISATEPRDLEIGPSQKTLATGQTTASGKPVRGQIAAGGNPGRAVSVPVAAFGRVPRGRRR